MADVPQFPPVPMQSPRRIQPGYTMVSITSLRDLRRLLRLVVLLQLVNMAFELRGWWQ